MTSQEHNINAMKQLIFDLAKTTANGLDGLIDHGGVHTAIATLKAIVNKRILECISPILVHGVSGSGKTAILRAFVNSVRASKSIQDSGILLIGPQMDSNRFPDLERLDRMENDLDSGIRLLAIDDIHKLSGDDAYCFWNMYNKLNRDSGKLVMTSRLHPSEMFQGNDHLRSRLMAGLVIDIAPPDDAARIQILHQMATNHGFRLSQDVCIYLLRRKSRNLKELKQIVELLDVRSMETKRPVTIPLVKKMEEQGII